MKAVALSSAEDIAKARTYESVADRLLFDAKPPKGATRPGGNALAFDWELLRGTTWKLPWLLAGGLDARNLKEAVRVSGAPGVDVSSGVESSPGMKNLGKIEEFLAAARAL
jgi:phosphoribosylanthranilate isomerase